MTHPYARAGAYPWHRPEAAHLHHVLCRDLPAWNDADLLIKRTAPGALPLPESKGADTIWKIVLEQVALAGALLDLCRILVGMQARVQRVADAAQAVLDLRSLVERRVGQDGRIVFGREPFRELLERLAMQQDDVDAIKVLLVRGEADSGKSWSRYLFERSAAEHGAEVTYIREGMVASVQDVIDRLFGILRASHLKPPLTTTPEAWYLQVSYALVEAASRFERPLWIAMDDLGTRDDGLTPLIDTQIRDFFDIFGLQLVDPAAYKWFRLLLLHYPDTRVPTRWGRELWQMEQLRVADVGEEDVIAVVEERLADHDLELPATEVRELARQIIAHADAQLPPEDPGCDAPRLQRIHDDLQRRLRTLVGGKR